MRDAEYLMQGGERNGTQVVCVDFVELGRRLRAAWSTPSASYMATETRSPLRIEQPASGFFMRGGRSDGAPTMSARVLGETPISVSQAAKEFCRQPTREGVRWWITRGRQDCKLEAVMISGRYITSREACERFAAATGLGLAKKRRRKASAAA